MESAKIYNERHITCDTQMYYKFRVCNICQDAEISEGNEWGVCTACVNNRVADELWTMDEGAVKRFSEDEAWESESELPNIRTNECGERIDEKDFDAMGPINDYKI